MKKMWCSKWIMVIGLLGLIATISVNGIQCGDAVNAMIPCGGFLLGAEGPKPSSGCCASIQSLNNQAKDTASRRAICECFKQSGPSFGVKPERAKMLPSLCKLKLNLPISPNVDCNNIK